MQSISQNTFHKVPLQLWKRPCVQEFRRLFYENCQWRGVPRYVEMFFKYIVTQVSPPFGCQIMFLISEKSESLELTCLFPGSPLQRLSTLLATHGAVVSNFLAFLRTGSTNTSSNILSSSLFAIFCLLLVLTPLICVLSDTSLLWGNCLVRAKKNQTKIKPSDSKIDFFFNFSRIFPPIQRERETLHPE